MYFTKTISAPRAMMLAGALMISASAASAATIVATDLSVADLDALTPAPNDTPSSTTGVYYDNVVGTQFDGGAAVTRSVWQDTINEAAGVYSSVQEDSTATFTFGGLQDSLSLIWGSPDDYNDIIITLTGGAGDVVINGAAVQGPVGVLASMVTIFDVEFDTVTFTSGENAFEFANLEVTPVPLPAGMLLMGTALGGLAVLRRRRKDEA